MMRTSSSNNHGQEDMSAFISHLSSYLEVPVIENDNDFQQHIRHSRSHTEVPFIEPLQVESLNSTFNLGPSLCVAGIRLPPLNAPRRNELYGHLFKKLFTMCLPYTSAAFHEDLDSLLSGKLPESYDDHWDHLVNGDAVVVAGWSRKKGTRLNESVCGALSRDATAAPVVLVAHHLSLNYKVPHKSLGQVVVRFGKGVCVDPKLSAILKSSAAAVNSKPLNISTIVTSAGLLYGRYLSQVLGAVLFTVGVTQNPRVPAMGKKAFGAPQYPLDPFASKDEENEIKELALNVLKQHPGTAKSLPKYDSNAMVFRKLYPPHYVNNVFKGKAGMESPFDRFMSPQEGDAAVMVTDLRKMSRKQSFTPKL